MKIFFVFVLMIITHFSYAQVKTGSEKITDDVKELNKGLDSGVYKYDENDNILHYQIFFPDKESFTTLTHFKSVESIFSDAYNKLDSTGDLEKIVTLGVDELKFVIKNENNGDIFVSKLIELGSIQARIGSSEMNIK